MQSIQACVMLALQLMQGRGLRQTRNRVVVLQLLLALPQQEFSCQSMYQTLLLRQSPVPMSTVYATLREFDHAGLAMSRVIDGERHYRLKP